MKVVFYASDKPREHMLARALGEGVRLCGDEFEIRRTADYGESPDGEDMRYPGPTPDTDVAVFFGVKGKSRLIMEDHRAMKKATLYIDKGITRQKGEGGHTEYSRVSINAPHPLAYMMRRDRPGARFKRLGLKMARCQRLTGGHILFCGSSAKYHEFHRLAEPTRYAEKVLTTLRKFTDRSFLYRPKPSADLPAISIASFSPGSQSILDALRGAHCLVTHGSSAAVDAIFAGVPVIALGPTVARPVAEEDPAMIDKPAWRSEEDRYRWACAMAYCQWTTAEFRTGEAWTDMKEDLEWLSA